MVLRASYPAEMLDSTEGLCWEALSRECSGYRSYLNAWMPVMSAPVISRWMSWVPS